MTREERRQAWMLFNAGALASGKTAKDAGTEADKAVQELEDREDSADADKPSPRIPP